MKFKSFKAEEGVPSPLVWSITEDIHQYVWVATDAGLARFENGSFRQISSVEALGAEQTVIFAQGGNGQLLMGTKAPVSVGEVIFSEDGSVAGLKKIDIGATKKATRVSALAVSQDGNIFVGTDGDGLRVVEDGKKSSHLAGKHIYQIVIEPQGSALLALNGGVARYHEGRVEFLKGTEGEDVRSIVVSYGNRSFQSFFTERDLYFATRNGKLATIRALSSDKETLDVLVQPTGVEIAPLIIDSRDVVWGGARNEGLLHYNIRSKEFEFINAKNGLGSGRVISLTEDKEGTIWVGSNHGLSKLNASGFVNYRSQDGVPSNSIWSIARLGDDFENSTILVGTDSGLGVLRNGTWETWTSKTGLVDDWVFSLAVKSKNEFFVAGADVATGGITRVTLVNDKPIFKTWRRAEGLPSGRVYVIRFDHTGALLGGTSAGLVRLVNGEIELVPITGATDSVRIYSIAAHTERTWIGTSEGLALLEGGETRLFTTEDGLPDNKVKSVAVARDGSVWMRFGSGVGAQQFALEKEGTLVNLKGLSTANGIQTDHVFSVGIDKNGSVWLGTTKGVASYQNGKLKLYSMEDGLVWDDTNFNSFFADSDGSVWIGTANGLSHFLPEYNVSLPAPSVSGLEVSLGGERVSSGIEVEPEMRDFHAVFTSPSYVAEDKLLFRYRLTGYRDGSWSDYGTAREVSLTNLPPGKFWFQAQAQRPGGLGGRVTQPFHFSIKAPYYKTGWFYFLALVIVLACIAKAVSFYLGRYQREQQRLELVIRESTQEVSDKADQLQVVAFQKSTFVMAVSAELRKGLTEIMTPLHEEAKRNPQNANLASATESFRDLLKLVDELANYDKKGQSEESGRDSAKE